MGNFIVVGGAGYIGVHLCKYLADLGHNVYVIDNFSSSRYYPQTQHSMFSGAVGSKYNRVFLKTLSNGQRNIKQIAADAGWWGHKQIDSVFFLASKSIVSESIENPLKYYKENVSFFINFMDIMKDTHVKSIVLSSSAAVYGDAQYSPILECDPLEPINPYGQTKLMMESILEDCRKRYGIQYAALRYFNAAGCDPYGEIGELHTPETHLIPLVIQAILSRNYVLKVFGNKHITADGTCIRDYVHVNDLASAHLLAANYTTGADAKSGIFNLSTGYGTSVMEIINMTEEITGRKVRYEICDARQGEPDTLFAATDLAFRELNWVPQYSVRECIAHAWKFYNH